MGIQKSLIQTQPFFTEANWDQLYFDYGACVLASKHDSNLQIEQNSLMISNEREMQLATDLVKLRKADPFIVNIISFQLLTDSKLSPRSAVAALVYNERIPIRLSHIRSAPFPDALHLYMQAIWGFEKLVNYFGYFIVNESCLGVNQQHAVKVWHNPNFSCLHPFETAFSEQQMRCIDTSLMPREEPNFRCFLYKQVRSLKFGYVKQKLWEYAKHFNRGEIPKHLKFIEQQGGALAVRHKNQQYYKSRLVKQPHYSNKPIFIDYNACNSFMSSNSCHNINSSFAKQQAMQLCDSRFHPIARINQNPHLMYEQTNPNFQMARKYITNGVRSVTCFQKQPTIRITTHFKPTNSNGSLSSVFITHHNQNYLNSRKPTTPIPIITSFTTQNFKLERQKHSEPIARPTIIRIQSNGLLLKQLKSQYSDTKTQLHNSKTNFTKSTIFEAKTNEELDLRKRPISERNNYAAESNLHMPNWISAEHSNHFKTINDRLVNRELKPLLIKQSIQGHFKKDHTKQIINNMPIEISKKQSSLQSSVQSPYFGRNQLHQQSIRPTQNQSQTVQNKIEQNKQSAISFYKRNSLEQKRPKMLINLSRFKNATDQIQIEEKKESTQNKNQSPRSRVPIEFNIENDSFSSIGPGITRQNTQKIFYDIREAESVNNSTRYFNGSVLHDEYSQIMELTSPLDFRLKQRMVPKQFIKEEPLDNDGMSSSKIIDASPQWDLLQQMRAVKNELNNIQQIPLKSGRAASKHRSSGSKQFRGELAKLGFQIPEDSASERESQRVLTEGIIQQSHYNDSSHINSRYNQRYDEVSYQSKMQLNKMLLKEKEKNQYSEIVESAKLPSYSTSTKPSTFQQTNGEFQGNYKFEWDPELLADMQQSALHE